MKDFFLSEREIQDLAGEPKKAAGYTVRSILLGMTPKSGRGASVRQFSCEFPRLGGGDRWSVYLRQNMVNPLDFSCGLWLLPEKRAIKFPLARYNGKSHRHTNHLEREPAFYDFHIHRATERYQASSYGDEHYAQVTNRYSRLRDAFGCLLADYNISLDVEKERQAETSQ